MISKNLIPWLFVITAFTAVLLPMIVKDGMFMDGLWYAVISRNMAHGAGSLWAPHFSDTLFPVFYDHPPLVFGIQSIFFRAFGDSFTTERLYTFLTAIITLALIVRLWKIITEPGAFRALGWLPVFFWLTVPLVHWAYSNNMLENTMGIFTLAAFIVLWKSLKGEKVNYLYTALAAALVTCAFLCKGFTGLFPLAFYFLHWLAFRKHSFRTMAIQSVSLILLTAVLFLLLFLYPPSAHSLLTYMETQVMSSIEGLREPVGRFFVIKRVLMELVALIPVTIVLIAVMRKRGLMKDHPYKKHSLFFLLSGLSAWLPIIVSQKQSGFYALNAMPFLALSAAAITAPFFALMMERMRPESMWCRSAVVALCTAFVLVIAYSVTSFRNPRSRSDREKLQLVHLVGPILKGQTIGVCSKEWHDWTLHGYFARYYNVSLHDKNLHPYYISDTCNTSGLVPVDSINIHLASTKLYRRDPL